MTHEQKPESAEFRTREEQIETMTVHYMEAGFPINAARRLARDGVAEAEDRGAVEQRRKDAEGAEPVWWVDPASFHNPLEQSGDHDRDRFAVMSRVRLGERDIPLYTRPADIATELDISAIIRAVCELPDRSSPEHQPDMMQVTQDELRLILEAAQPANVTALEKALNDIGNEVLEGAEPFLDAVIRILKTVGIDPLNGSDPVDQVADLEDRIADLKRSLMNIREAIELADPKVLVGTLWMPGQPETVVDYISAAIREGGEHG